MYKKELDEADLLALIFLIAIVIGIPILTIRFIIYLFNYF